MEADTVAESEAVADADDDTVRKCVDVGEAVDVIDVDVDIVRD